MSHDLEDTGRVLPQPRTNTQNKAYKVVVRTSGSIPHFRAEGPRRLRTADGNLPCVKAATMSDTGEVIVVTDDPTLIYQKFGTQVVVSITEIGVGFCLPHDVP